MSTEKQIAANRGNARRSTGPRTPEGKAVIRANARRHGLASRDVVLPEENRAEFEDLLAALRVHHQPQGALEECLVAQMAAAEWRLRRIARIETGLLIDRLDDVRDDLDIEQSSSSESPYAQNTRLLGIVFRRNCDGGSVVKLLRYDSSARRAFYKALHELKLLQSRRVHPPVPTLNFAEQSQNGVLPAN